MAKSARRDQGVMTQRKIVAICGPRGCGKSTLAKAIRKYDKFVITSFADPLKQMLVTLVTTQGCSAKIARSMFYGDLKNTPTEYLGGKTPVYAMQTLGTEWGRNLINPYIWANTWRRKILTKHKNDNIVVDDLRFITEQDVIDTFDNTYIIGVERDGYGPGNHQSEREYLHLTRNAIIQNKSSNRIQETLYEQYKALQYN